MSDVSLPIIDLKISQGLETHSSSLFLHSVLNFQLLLKRMVTTTIVSLASVLLKLTRKVDSVLAITCRLTCLQN